MPSFEAVIFDVDGTLLDASAGILNSVSYAIGKLGLEPLAVHRLREFIGPPIQESFSRAYGLTEAQAQEAAEVFREFYRGNDLYNAVPYAGIHEVFECLRVQSVPIGIATYKRHDYAVQIVDHFGFAGYCVAVNGADPFNRMKKKDIIEKTMVEMNVACRERVVYVGDTLSDGKSSAELGIGFLAVLYGFGFKTCNDADRCPNIGVVRTPGEMIRLLG